MILFPKFKSIVIYDDTLKFANKLHIEDRLGKCGKGLHPN